MNACVCHPPILCIRRGMFHEQHTKDHMKLFSLITRATSLYTYCCNHFISWLHFISFNIEQQRRTTQISLLNINYSLIAANITFLLGLDYLVYSILQQVATYLFICRQRNSYKMKFPFSLRIFPRCFRDFVYIFNMIMYDFNLSNCLSNCTINCGCHCAPNPQAT